MLTDAQRQTEVPHHRVLVRRAHITGTVDLEGLDVSAEVAIDASRIEGEIILNEPHWARWLRLDESVVTGDLTAERMHSESLYLRKVVISGNASLRGANVDGSIEMDGASFAKTLDANNLSVGASLLMRDGATFGGDVFLVGAKIDGNIETDGATFAKTLSADSVSVGGGLYMDNGTTFRGDVILRSAKVGGQLSMTNASFAKTLDAQSVHVGRSLLMCGDTVFGGRVDLSDAEISDSLYLNGATIAGLISQAPSSP